MEAVGDQEKEMGWSSRVPHQPQRPEQATETPITMPQIIMHNRRNPSMLNRLWASLIMVGVLAAAPVQATLLVDDDFNDGDTRPVVKDGNIKVSEATTPGVDGNWQAQAGSNWTMGPGTQTLYVTSTWEGGVGLLVDLASIDGAGGSRLELSFDIVGDPDPADNLYVHLWGFVSNDHPDESTINSFANFNSINGMWESTDLGYDPSYLDPGAVGPFDDYNLGGVDGAFTGNSGVLSDAAVAGLPGVVGSYTFYFDLGAFTTAPQNIGDYDYILIGFQRDIGPETTTAFQIDNLRLEVVPEPSTVMLFMSGAWLLYRVGRRKGFPR